MTALLILIYAAFISLGIPDSLLGATWPAMHQALGVSVSMAGPVSLVTSLGTVVSSLLSVRVIARFGTGKVMVVSVAMTALALLGFSLAPAFPWLLVFGIPLGLGAGAVDSALNNFVALHYEAKHMNWLHCFWGVGASMGPVIIGAVLQATGSWRGGYSFMTAFQMVFAGILLVTLPLWKKAKEEKHADEASIKMLSLGQSMGLPKAKPVFAALLFYCGAEATMGLWSASFLVGAKGIAPEQAAIWVSAFYLGITVGRFASGFLSMRLNHARMILLGEGCALVGVVLLLCPIPTALLPVAIFLVGLGFAPIFPAILHQTPLVFGSEVSQSMMGLQMAMAYVGNIVVPPLFGFLATWLSLGALPIFVGVFVLLMVGCTSWVQNRMKER